MKALPSGRRAGERHYGFANLGTMQEAWLEWVKSGRPRISPESSLITQQLARRDGVVMASAAANEPAPQPVAAAIYRGQSPDSVTPIAAVPIVSAPIAAAPMNVAPSDPAAKVPTSTTVAVGGSVYAASAARAEQARAETGAIGTAAPARTGASIYDATRELGVIRR
jgi:hypothetical protein